MRGPPFATSTRPSVPRNAHPQVEGGLDTAVGPTTLPRGTFRIDREGTWRHEGQEVTHEGVLRNLYANLRAEGDSHYLQVGLARIPVSVDDAPFVVNRIEVVSESCDANHCLRIYLTDGSAEWLSFETFWIGRGNIPYCRVKSGCFSARLSVSAWLQLAAFVEEGPDPGATILVIGSLRFPIPRLE